MEAVWEWFGSGLGVVRCMERALVLSKSIDEFIVCQWDHHPLGAEVVISMSIWCFGVLHFWSGGVLQVRGGVLMGAIRSMSIPWKFTGDGWGLTSRHSEIFSIGSSGLRAMVMIFTMHAYIHCCSHMYNIWTSFLMSGRVV
jgi:hypothetical protein